MSSKNVIESQLGQQLSSTPPQSSLVLESIIDGSSSAPAPPPEEAETAETARNFMVFMLTEAYLPPPETPFVPFAQEEGRFDVVRARYRVMDTAVEIAQTMFVVSVTISKEVHPTGDCVAFAEQMTREALAPREPIRLIVSGTARGRTLGRTDNVPSDIRYPHWDEKLRWWCAPGKVGFMSLTVLGHPTKAVATFDEEQNARWFSLLRRGSARKRRP